ncbi:MAG: helicase C-terminal domain-containing protein [Candidatus Bipolaricaulis sp.]|nr:helicase C-terminal domain-containing protein [Candidatus Bipolaricaulis sp.]
MSLPWTSLGLERFVAGAGGEGVVFAEGVPQSASAADLDAPRVGYGERTGGALDIAPLVRAVFPCAADHGVAAIAHYLELPDGSPAEKVGRILVRTLEEIPILDRDVVALLAEVLPPPLARFLVALLPMSAPHEEPETVTAKPAAPSETPAGTEEVLGPDGIVATALSRYETRSGQLAMASRVEDVFRRGGALSVEAGPGTGKTFAYLVPAILKLREDKTARVVVCTRTKQLQEQLFREDLPFLVERIAPTISTAMLKGRENYLCLRRWEILLQELVNGLERDRLAALAPLVRWLSDTETGDVEENSAFLADPSSRDLWARLYDSPHHCVGAFCPHMEGCFSIQARRRARKADLVVVNHSLLLADAAAHGVVLGKYSHLVVDEAHAFEAAARSAFTASLSQSMVERVVEQLAPPRNRRGGWVGRLPLAPEDEEALRAGDAAAVLPGQASRLFLSVESVLSEERRGRLPDLSAVRDDLEAFRVAVRGLGVGVEALIERVREEQDLAREGEGGLAALRELENVAGVLAREPNENAVHWYEREGGRLSLHVTPLDVAPILAECLYPDLEAAVLTSATLSLGGDFTYVHRALGVDEAFSDVQGMVAESPFSYAGRMRILVPRRFPAVLGDAETYADALAELLIDLHGALHRNGLVLFTSYDLLQRVRERLVGTVPVLAQGVDGPRTSLVERFRRGKDGMLLLGADSFWEGVDLPGEELEVLVVTRLPFAVPTDPVFAALSERYERTGREPFYELALPQAVLRLRQGVGRLIRTQRDRGVVVVTDDRIRTKSYGRKFAEGLPVPVEEAASAADLVLEAAAWFERLEDEEGSPQAD